MVLKKIGRRIIKRKLVSKIKCLKMFIFNERSYCKGIFLFNFYVNNW